MNRVSENLEVLHEAPRRPSSPGEPATLVDVFTRVARVHKRPDTLNYKHDGRWVAISSDELMTRAKQIAAGLHAIGLQRGDRIALLSESRVEWTLTDAGCIFAGIIDVPIYPTLTAPQVCYILKDSGSSALVIEGRAKYDELKEIFAECPRLQHIIYFDRDGLTAAEGLSLAELEEIGRQFEQKEPGRIDELAREVTPDDLVTIIYTSGTTGEPKGVMLSHSNIVTNLLDSTDHLDFGEKDVALSVLPLSHVYERQAMYMYLHEGIAVYFAESLQTIGPNLREVHPTVFVGVPRIFEKIYARIQESAAEKGKFAATLLAWAVAAGVEYSHYELAHKPAPLFLRLKHFIATKLVFAKWHDAFGGRIRLLLSGGAALSEELARIYIGAGIPIIQGYGLTETSPVITASHMNDIHVGTVGKAIPNVEIRIAADGEIEVRGPNVMRGYYNKPEETRAVFTDDGWFKTGDVGMLDAEGFLRITDRKKELFKTSGGKYIAPQPIEQAIKSSRFVNQVVLIGAERKFPAALIVPEWEQLESYCKFKGIDVKSRREMCEHPRIIDLFQRQIDKFTPDLARYEKIKKVALLENEFSIEGGELTPTLKVKRRVIDQKYRDVIEKLYKE
ncbi:MAG TPA: long-chain fatty acid--CoA ligase [Pyrinomonadaceae bacterium]|nr:long-chain fatty acid--CoA ligase [Pyrinomonadaceae bacterium]